jgi:hypothetical protein
MLDITWKHNFAWEVRQLHTNHSVVNRYRPLCGRRDYHFNRNPI